jgi:uncharacterized protein (TIGR02145 family)
MSFFKLRWCMVLVLTGVVWIMECGSPKSYHYLDDSTVGEGGEPNICGKDGSAGSCRTVTIGNQTWMAENLNREMGNSWCYGEGAGAREFVGVFEHNKAKYRTLSSDEIQANCNRYGRLYDWKTAKMACPAGYHLPSRAEWSDLLTAVGGSSVAGKKLRSKNGWSKNANGTDDYGFSALPGGGRDPDGTFVVAGDGGAWWTATENGSKVITLVMNYMRGNEAFGINNIKSYGVSVRCVQDVKTGDSYEPVVNGSNTSGGGDNTKNSGDSYESVVKGYNINGSNTGDRGDNTISSATGLAAQGVWDGSANTSWYTSNFSAKAFTINTAEELAGLAKLVNDGVDMKGKTFKLGGNIVLNDTANWRRWESVAPANRWVGIGKSKSNNFKGTFDGNGFIVSGIYIKDATNLPAGLFGSVGKGGIIKNVGVTALHITCNGYVGGLIGALQDSGIVTNCFMTGTITGYDDAGGLIGITRGYGKIKIIDCFAIGSVSARGSVGGLIGYANEYDTIKNCYATGNVSNYVSGYFGLTAGAGGLAGGGTAINCYATGSVLGAGSVGGLLGRGKAINSYATGSVSGDHNVGGLIGRGTAINSYATGNVTGKDFSVGGLVGGSGSATNSYATGNVSGKKYVGGLIGASDGYEYATYCYAIGSVSGTEYVGGLVGAEGEFRGFNPKGPGVKSSYYNGEISGRYDEDKGTPKLTSEMKKQSTYVGWDFVKIWVMDTGNDGYPYFRWQKTKSSNRH